MPMRPFLEIAATGLVAARRHPLRSAVSVAALVAVLAPFVVGTALAQGLEAEAEASARFGADLYVNGSQFGRPAPLPLEAVDRIGHIEGVSAVVPRIVGRVSLGRDRVSAVLIGMPPESFPVWAASVEGRLPHSDGSHELVVGTALASRLGLKCGSTLLPFYRNDQRGERPSQVVGIFKRDAPLWQANLILTTLSTAQAVFEQEGLATDLLVTCRPGYQAAVSRAIERSVSFPSAAGRGTIRTTVTAREDLLALIPRGLLHREGLFNLHFLLAFVIGILVLLVVSGFGLAERRREIGILKATGWQTDEVLVRGAAESLTLSVAGASLAVLMAWLWLRVFNGYGVAAFFIAGAGVAPEFPLPFRLTPVPALLGLVISLAVVLTGTLYASWRAATVSPRDAMR
jgi:ABC-type lipoprotein release transport system permease subunit